MLPLPNELHPPTKSIAVINRLPQILRSLLLVLVIVAQCLYVPAQRSYTTQDIDSLFDKGDEAFNEERYLSALECFIEANTRANATDLYELQCITAHRVGVCYFKLSELGSAMKYYEQAYELCVKHDFDIRIKLRIQNGIAGVYFEEMNWAKARELTLECFNSAMELNDSSSIRQYATNLALLSNKIKQFDDTEKFAGMTREYSRNGDISDLGILGIEAEALFLQGKNKELKEIVPKILANPLETADNKGSVLIYLIEILTVEGKLAEAFSHIEQASNFVSVRNKPMLFETVARLCEKSGDLKGVIACKDSLLLYQDSITHITNRQLIESSRIRLEITQLSAEIDRQVAEVAQSRRISNMLMFILILLSAIGILVIYIMRSRNRQHRVVMQLNEEKLLQEKQLAEKELHETRLEADYKQALMSNEIEHQNKLLSMTTMFIASRNELIEDVLSQLSEIKEIQWMPKLSEMVRNLRQILKDSAERDNFLVNFESANPEFVRSLKEKHHDLSSSDIRFLAYIRMNLSTKDIAALINITPDSCKRRKIRISKKLGLESSADLYEYIIGI